MSSKTEITKVCIDCNEEFTIDSGDLDLYEKVGLVLPSKCFECRMKQYFIFSIFGKFRKGVSNLSGESLITVLPNNPRFPIYKSHEWWGDGWDPMEHSQDYNPKRSFFDQLKELEKIKLDSYEGLEKLKKEFETTLKKEAVHKENSNLRCINSVGNYMTDCDKCANVFAWEYSQNCRNCLRGLKSKDCIDMAFSWNLELSGTNSGVDGGYQIKYSGASEGKYSEYVDLCKDVEYCFGCVGLRKKKYCILNKQYAKEEYEELKEKIISDMKKRGEYGKFLPYSMSPGYYNFSNGMIYFPEIKKEEVKKRGGYWLDEDLFSEDGISSQELPDSIANTQPGISFQALICPETHFRFNIAPAEYEFHKRKNFALPRLHFDRRILKRMKKISVLKNYPYQCFYCEKDIMAYYPSEWGYQKIACEECYKQNIA